MCMFVVICKIDHCIHIHWCIPMELGHNDPWVESHMWPQQTWGQRSSRGQWPLVQVFGKKGQCIHILWCIFKSNITMIAKVCDRESRRDSWFENRLVEETVQKLSVNIGNYITQDSHKNQYPGPVCNFGSTAPQYSDKCWSNLPLKCRIFLTDNTKKVLYRIERQFIT